MAKTKSTRLLLWLAGIGALIMVAATVAVVLLLQDGTPGFDEDQWLHVRFSPMLTDAPGNEGMLVDPADLPPLTSELSAALEHAATDDSVTGLLIDLAPIGIGWAGTQELRDAILAFKDSGKPCIVWSDQFTNMEYYLATACDDIRLPPAGITLVNGLAMTQSYYADTLAELGVSANFEHVGDFKSAVEPYERSGPSEAASEATDALLDSLYSQFLRGIAQGRGLSEEQAAALIDTPPMNPEDALARGMVDKLQYRDQMLDEVGEERRRMSDYLRKLRQDWKSGEQTVAVIYAEGAIVGGESGSQLFGGSMIGDRTVSSQLRDVREDDDISAVVLRVNSPGGSGSASDTIWREVALTREVKPVVISMGDYAASGGYYISMGADHIFAEPGTLTGSIGVFGGKMNLSGFYEEWLKVSHHTYKRGEQATLFSSMSDFNDSERAVFRSFLQGFYTTFVTKAAEGREMSYEDLHAVAQGRVWTGEQALERNLIDELGSTNDAIRHAASLANTTDYAIKRIPERKSFIEQLLDEMADPEAAAAIAAELPEGIRSGLSDAAMLETVLGAGGPVVMLPGTIEVR
ncbi:MAG: signal peptide peptidase SppA [Myxococcota bacterium]|nr:signal peptide peptidase SppA [Myxococcota bacterium]